MNAQLSHKPPEGFMQFEMVWVDDFPRDQQTFIQERVGAALRDGTLQGCHACRMMKARVYHLRRPQATFVSFVDCACRQAPSQKLVGQSPTLYTLKASNRCQKKM